MASIIKKDEANNTEERVQLVKFLTGSIDKFKTGGPDLDAGTLYFAHSDLSINGDNTTKDENGNTIADESKPYKNQPYGYIVYDVPHGNSDSDATRVVMGDHARITTYLENPIYLRLGGSTATDTDGHDVGEGTIKFLQGRATDADENGTALLGSYAKPIHFSYEDIGADLSSYWTQGTTEGPILTLNVNSVEHAFGAIPAATAGGGTDSDGNTIPSASGIVTTDEQSFAGAKTFKAPLTIEVTDLNRVKGDTQNNFIIQAEDTINGYAYPGLTFGMSKQEESLFPEFVLAINDGAPLRSDTHYQLSFGKEYYLSLIEDLDADEEDYSYIKLGAFTHTIITPISTKKKGTISTDLGNFIGQDLVTPFYLKDTVYQNKGALLTVGQYGLLTPAATLGDANTPFYLDNGVPTATSKYAGGTKLTVNGTDLSAQDATVYAPVEAPTDNETKWTVGWNGTKPYWMDSSTITPAALGKGAGSATQPIYFADGGVPTACSFQILSGEPI